jgi:hypothetical protein
MVYGFAVIGYFDSDLLGVRPSGGDQHCGQIVHWFMVHSLRWQEISNSFKLRRGHEA